MRKNNLTGGKRRKRRTLKHRRKKSHKRRTRVKKRRRSRHRGGYSGAGNMIITPATFSPTNAYPPNGPVDVPNPGITKVAVRGDDQQYYYQHNKKVISAPESTNSQKQKGGKRRKSKRKHKKRKHKRRTRKRKRSRKRRRRHRGGALSDVVESIPGGTDARDVYYKAGNLVGSLYSQYTGFGPTNQPPMTNYTTGQPINDPVQITPGDIPMDAYIQDGSAQAAKFTASYK